MQQETLILNNTQVNQKINRIAYQLYETFAHQKGITIVGIAGQGFVIAEKIKAALANISDLDIKLEEIKFSKQNPEESDFTYSGDIDAIKCGNVVLVDDVLNSGRTLIYAAKFLLRQPLQQLVTTVLVDRIHRKFPIKADFVGLSLSTTIQEHIEVRFKGDETNVYLQ